MFLLNQSRNQIEKYEKFLKIAGSLSNLFSDSAIPYLYYRVAEKVFCKSFDAEDLSRGDVSADAKKGSLGIGLKTFLVGNNNTYQKIAEFNSDRSLYSDLSPELMIRKIAELRNARIEFTERTYNLKNGIYHCVVRNKDQFLIYEESMDKVNISGIKKIKINSGSIIFEDGKNDYSFLLSKSTLTKRFKTKPINYEIAIEILKDPFSDLSKLFAESGLLFESVERIKDTILLPLYGSDKTVYEKSGLNQWNAGGRDRNGDEVYIPVPASIHARFPSFFPDRDTNFRLRLPNGDIMQAKICQSDGKALMSSPNKSLGKWLLRDVLKVPEGELITYDKLQAVGVDSVRIDKINNSEFEMNFATVDSFENFRSNVLE